MPDVTRSHQYTFDIYHEPTVDEMIEELMHAKDIVSGSAKCRIRAGDSQFDGYSINVTVSGAT
jgi:hypothetical protein